jgi:hypothetical protein
MIQKKKDKGKILLNAKIAKEANRVMSPAEQLLAQLLVDIKRKQKKEIESRISKTCKPF